MENHPSTVQNSSGIRVRVSDLLFAVQKRWTIILALSFIGLIFGLILSAMTYVRSSFQSYIVRGSFAVTTVNENGMYINNASAPNNNDYHLAEDMMDAVKYIVRSDRVIGEVINKLEMLGYTTQDLKNAITLTQYNTTQIMEMSFTWRNAEESVAIWNEIVGTASQVMPETLQMGTLAVINEPEAELVGVGGGRSSMAVLLTLLGFSAGLGYAVIELLMHPTLNNVRDVEPMFGLETIGVIPRDNAYFRRKGSLLVQGDSGSATVVQNYSAAAYILRNRLGTREKNHCFYVTSAIAGEGKTTVAANLAIQLSDMEHRTLLIDFDTRNPNLGSLFLENVDYAHSLNALYHGDSTEEEAITTLTGYLDLLPAVLEHNVMVMDGMIVELFRKLCEKYEYVILDAPPVGQYSDTLSLNQIANTVLFVIGYDKSSIPEIQNALEKLDKSGIRVLGCVVNSTHSSRNGSKDSERSQKRKLLSAGEKTGIGGRTADSGVNADAADGDAVAEITKNSGTGIKRASWRKNSKKTKKRGADSSAEAGSGGTEPDGPPDEKDQTSGAPAGRNLMEDLMAGENTEKSMSDQDTVSALLKMGIEGKPQNKKQEYAESDEDRKEDVQEELQDFEPEEPPTDEPEEPPTYGPEEPQNYGPEEPSTDEPEELPTYGQEEPQNFGPAEPQFYEPEEPQTYEQEEPRTYGPAEPQFFGSEELPAGEPAEDPAGGHEEPQSRGKKEKGKKGKGKKGGESVSDAERELQAEWRTEQEELQTRGEKRKGKKGKGSEPDAERELQADEPAEQPTGEQAEPENRGKKGKGKKGRESVSDAERELQAEWQAEEAERQTRGEKGKGKKGKKSGRDAEKDLQADEPAEPQNGVPEELHAGGEKVKGKKGKGSLSDAEKEAKLRWIEERTRWKPDGKKEKKRKTGESDVQTKSERTGKKNQAVYKDYFKP